MSCGLDVKCSLYLARVPISAAVVAFCWRAHHVWHEPTIDDASTHSTHLAPHYPCLEPPIPLNPFPFGAPLSHAPFVAQSQSCPDSRAPATIAICALYAASLKIVHTFMGQSESVRGRGKRGRGGESGGKMWRDSLGEIFVSWRVCAQNVPTSRCTWKILLFIHY